MKRRSGFSKVELIVGSVFSAVLIVAGFLFVALMKADPTPRSVRCATNMKQIGMAMMQYAQENDERLPPVALNNVPQSLPPYKKPFGWADAISVFIPDRKVFECPSANHHTPNADATQRGFTDYWFNSNASSMKLGKFTSPMQTILLGDGNDGADNTNARYSLNALPQSWRDTDGSPARRHNDGANYAFADGHVHIFKPEQINNLLTQKSRSTFSIR